MRFINITIPKVVDDKGYSHDVEDIPVTLLDVWEAVRSCDGCCLDEIEDVNLFMQTLLDISCEKKDSRP